MKQFVCTVLGFALMGSAALAQMPGSQPPRDPCAALARFFDKEAQFSATAKVVTTGKKASDKETLETRLAVSGRKMRNEMDMTKMSSVPAADREGMKQMGMDQIVILALPEKSATYMVFPGMKAYCDMPVPQGKAGTEGELKKTEIGSETVGKHPCKKSKLTLTDKDGKTAEALVWEATDMKGFPIQYETVESGRTTTTTFTDIKMEKPDAALFELPKDHKHYGSMQEMIMGNMQRMMQGLPGR
jgi:outer membrane lipoprotein-sorting protein